MSDPRLKQIRIKTGILKRFAFILNLDLILKLFIYLMIC
jgi:hypothetical protein